MSMSKKFLFVIPVYNEERNLENSLITLCEFMERNCQNLLFEILIADNASSDRTPEIAGSLSRTLPNVIYRKFEKKGRGRTLKTVWTEVEADFYCYMDADLSTDLSAIPAMVKAFETAEIVTGSRRLKGSDAKRSLLRRMLSATLNLILKVVFSTGLSDTQCGFKAISKGVRDSILRKIRNKNWFFDTELLLCSEFAGKRIIELPVKWDDVEGSSVKIPFTILEFLLGITRLRIRMSNWERKARK